MVVGPGSTSETLGCLFGTPYLVSGFAYHISNAKMSDTTAFHFIASISDDFHVSLMKKSGYQEKKHMKNPAEWLKESSLMHQQSQTQHTEIHLPSKLFTVH